MSSRSAARHACSCGESTSTPSTSKIAPEKAVGTRAVPLALARSDDRLGGEVEGAAIAGIQLSDLPPDADLDRPAGALGVSEHREPARLEGHPDVSAAELHREGPVSYTHL